MHLSFFQEWYITLQDIPSYQVIGMEMKIKIDGMHCESCAALIRESLNEISGIMRARVSLGSAIIRYDEDVIDPERIRKIIEKEGFQVIP